MKRTSKTEEVPEGSGEAGSDSKAGHPLSRRKNVLRGAAFIVCVLFLLAAVLFWRLSGQGREGEPVSVPQEAVMAGTAGEGAYFLLSAMEDAQEQIQVESCMALSDGENFSLSGTAQRIPANDDGRFYLFALEVYEESIPEGEEPIAQTEAARNFTLTAAINEYQEDSRLYDKFVVAVKQNERYLAVSAPHYITNPEAIADYTAAFPEVDSIEASGGLSETRHHGVG